MCILFHHSGSKLWVLHRDPRGAAVQQREAPQQRRPVGGWDSSQHTGGLFVQINVYTVCKNVSSGIYFIVLHCIKEIICSVKDIQVNNEWAVKPSAVSNSVVRTKNICKLLLYCIVIVLKTWMMLNFINRLVDYNRIASGGQFDAAL